MFTSDSRCVRTVNHSLLDDAVRSLEYAVVNGGPLADGFMFELSKPTRLYRVMMNIDCRIEVCYLEI